MNVERIDHVHVEVADRERSAEWYERVFGLKRDPTLAVWAEDPMGPLILTTPGGITALSLFAREPKTVSRDATIAFRASGEEFVRFLAEINSLNLRHFSGRPLRPDDIVDHELSWSIYLVDPDGNRLEVTTYDYEWVASRE